jgi:hypothetical protein
MVVVPPAPRPGRCAGGQPCYLRGTAGIAASEPLERALTSYDARITGVRRDETSNRRQSRVVEWDDRREMFKVNLIVGWTGSTRRSLPGVLWVRLCGRWAVGPRCRWSWTCAPGGGVCTCSVDHGRHHADLRLGRTNRLQQDRSLR